MGLVINLIVQTIAWSGFRRNHFGAAGTVNYLDEWLYLGDMIVISVVSGVYFARIDPGLLRERLKPPIQKISRSRTSLFSDTQNLCSATISDASIGGISFL